MIALDSGETGWTEEDGPKDELAARVKELLLEKADMMNEYFSIVMDKVGNLRSLPVLLGIYINQYQVSDNIIFQNILVTIN